MEIDLIACTHVHWNFGYEILSVRLFEITVTGLRNTLFKTRLLVCIYFFTLSRMTEDLEEMYNLNVYKCC